MFHPRLAVLLPTGPGRRFSAFDFVEYRCLDLETYPLSQGFVEAGYDVVVAGNVLHATTDLKATLGRVRVVLAEKGYLLAGELHQPTAFALCFGLLHGSWLHTDAELRTNSTLLPRQTWPPLLEKPVVSGTSARWLVMPRNHGCRGRNADPGVSRRPTPRRVPRNDRDARRRFAPWMDRRRLV